MEQFATLFGVIAIFAAFVYLLKWALTRKDKAQGGGKKGSDGDRFPR